MEVTLLSKEELIDTPLDAIKKYGAATAPTDFAILLGNDVNEDRNKDTPDGEVACWQWTRTEIGSRIYTVYADDNTGGIGAMSSKNVVRPVLPPEETRVLTPENTKTGSNGTTIVEWGEYPQTVASKDISNQLKKMEEAGLLKGTGKKYVVNSTNGYSERFKPRERQEYEYKGKKYVKIEATPYDSVQHFSNDEEVVRGDDYWVEVQPIEWLKDPSGYWISKKGLISGIPFAPKHSSYNGDFEQTGMHDYLQTYFAKEMVAENTQTQTKKSIKSQLSAKQTDAETRLARRRARLGITQDADKKQIKVADQIKFFVNAGETIMLHGGSGVGKTEQVKQADPDLTSISLVNGILPEEVIGKNIPQEQPDGKIKTVWAPPIWYQQLCEKCAKEPNKKHILFLDEITNASEHTQALIFHIARARTIGEGFGKLPDNVSVVLAGNSKEESAAAYNMPAPLYMGMHHIHIEPNMTEWLEWATAPSLSHPEDPERLNCHPLVSAFIAHEGLDVLTGEGYHYDEEDPKKEAICPRTWGKFVSNTVYNCLQEYGYLRRELLIATGIGPQFADKLIRFSEHPPLGLEDVLAGDYGPDDIPGKIDEQMALAMSLRHATPKQIGQVRDFIDNNLHGEVRATFDELWVGQNADRALQLKHLKDAKQK